MTSDNFFRYFDDPRPVRNLVSRAKLVRPSRLDKVIDKAYTEARPLNRGEKRDDTKEIGGIPYVVDNGQLPTEDVLGLTIKTQAVYLNAEQILINSFPGARMRVECSLHESGKVTSTVSYTYESLISKDTRRAGEHLK